MTDWDIQNKQSTKQFYLASLFNLRCYFVRPLYTCGEGDRGEVFNCQTCTLNYWQGCNKNAEWVPQA